MQVLPSHRNLSSLTWVGAWPCTGTATWVGPPGPKGPATLHTAPSAAWHYLPYGAPCTGWAQRGVPCTRSRYPPGWLPCACLTSIPKGRSTSLRSPRGHPASGRGVLRARMVRPGHSSGVWASVLLSPRAQFLRLTLDDSEGEWW